LGGSLLPVTQSAVASYALGGVDFWMFWIFNILQLNLDWQKNSKTNVEKAFFFIFMSSYAEMSFWGKKREKVT
jgi:hypothetical protein